MEKQKNIFPVFRETISREEKEKFLKQKSVAIWLTGLSGSGKTTIAVALEKELYKRGFLTQVLDGDNIRSGINNNLSFTKEDRTENIRRIAEVTKLFLNCGIITLNSFISPRKEQRDLAREIIGKDDFIEVYVNTSLEVCEERDIKGLYKKARRGEIKNFTGIDQAYEAPNMPEIEVSSETFTLDEIIEEILNFLKNYGIYENPDSIE